MSYPRSLDEIPEEELRKEIRRRQELRRKGLCDYCERPIGKTCTCGRREVSMDQKAKLDVLHFDKVEIAEDHRTSVEMVKGTVRHASRHPSDLVDEDCCGPYPPKVKMLSLSEACDALHAVMHSTHSADVHPTTGLGFCPRCRPFILLRSRLEEMAK